MKQVSHYKLVLLVGLLAFTSCQKEFLERRPSDRPANELFFANETELLLALNGAYEGLYWQNSRVPYPVWFDSSTDIGFNRGDYAGMFTVQGGQFSTETEVFYTIWASLYQRIARCNNIISNMHKAKDVVGEDVYMAVEAQAKFLRAFFYHYLINLYGDVPFVTTMLSISESKVERTPKATIAEQLYADLDLAAQYLPETWTGDNIGRITKGAALSLKARIALLQGDYRIAAQAAKDVIDSDVYELHTDFESLFLLGGRKSKESILHIPFLRGVTTSGIPQYFGLRATQGWSVAVPRQTIVDFFQCIDGKHIDESSSYDPVQPYDNRDPRLKASILTPGQWFGDYRFENHPDSSTTLRKQGDNVVRVNNQEVTHAYATFTGYIWKKYLDPVELPAFTTQSEVDFMFIRFAEVLLTYAEAKIELNEIDATVIDAINRVRGRKSVEMPLVTEMDKASLTKLVRYERTAELAVEGHRLFDIRRWGYAEHIMKGNVLGRKTRAFYDHYPVPTIDAYGQSHYANEAEFFNVIAVSAFDPGKHYLWPIPQKDRDLNEKLGQNPNY